MKLNPTSKAVIYTNKERRAIIRWWSDSYQSFRFLSTGEVEARRDVRGAWGILYTADQAARHLATLKDSL